MNSTHAFHTLCLLVPLSLGACRSDATSDGDDGTEGAADGSDDGTAEGSGDSGVDETGDSGQGGQACYEYAPGEAGGSDFTPLITEAQLQMLDLTIEYPDTPIAALEASSTYLENLGLLRTTFVGLVEIDEANPSTALEFNDIPLSDLGPDSFTAELDGTATPIDRVTCTADGDTPVTVIFAVDVTGSMTPAISAVRNSLTDFVDAAVGLGLQGRIGVVTYQDTVGVNIPFEDCSGVEGLIPERSPFFAPVPLDDSAAVENLRSFIGALHADGGADPPENLAAAVDFATNNVIGYSADGTPNVIGEGDDDPAFTEPWPLDQLEGLVVVIGITDAPFHDPASSSTSLPDDFRPRELPEILTDLGPTVVSTIDPAFADWGSALDDDPNNLDADLWARYAGGFGRDWFQVDAFLISESISFFDLELLLLGQGLLEIPLAPALAATCVLEIDTATAPESVVTRIEAAPGSVTYTLSPDVVSY